MTQTKSTLTMSWYFFGGFSGVGLDPEGHRVFGAERLGVGARHRLGGLRLLGQVIGAGDADGLQPATPLRCTLAPLALAAPMATSSVASSWWLRGANRQACIRISRSA
ncbi:hypothetical protein NB693_23265 [Pantoea ananatis]|uniref:hypothetical protein n=1 Tax=Pantoea ananas TaxID=553 RepID=UPI00221ED75A|nr:hypothetical protein [Pantoea ananatis]